MGFWKDVAYDMSRGMSRESAIRVNAALRNENLSASKKQRIEALAEAEVKLNTMF